MLQKPKPTLKFAGQEYISRFTKDNLHEYTPKDQTDLDRFADMLTINDYPSVKDGDALAKTANSVLETYKSHGAKVIRTSSVPRTTTKPAEYLIVVLFARPEFIEASFARFVLEKGVGLSVVYSHRVYGKKAGDAKSKWLLANGEKREKELMKLAIPQVAH